MPKRVETQPLFEDCRIIFRNFSGEQSQYNPKGARNFCVIVDDMEVAKAMEADGWNIKYRQPLDEGGDETAYIPVAVSFDNVPPTVVLITSRGRTHLDESTISTLDYAEIENVDLILNPYNWEVNGKHGVKAYLKSMYVTIHEDPLARKYAETDNRDDYDNALPWN